MVLVRFIFVVTVTLIRNISRLTISEIDFPRIY